MMATGQRRRQSTREFEPSAEDRINELPDVVGDDDEHDALIDLLITQAQAEMLMAGLIGDDVTEGA